MSKIEIWKNIIGYEKIAQVSNLGRIKILAKKQIYLNRNQRERITSGHKNQDGYFNVGLVKNGKLKMYRVSRLVAIAFLDNPKNLPQVNHKDGNKENNFVSNLEWCDSSYNNKHAFQLGLNSAKGEKNRSAKLKEKDIQKIKFLYSQKKYTLGEIGKLFNVTESCIGLIVRGNRWQHICLT